MNGVASFETQGQIRVLDPRSEAPLWDRFVDQHPDATPFHTSLWTRLLAETYGLRPFYLIQQHGEIIRDALPLFETGGGLRKRRGVSVPFADICRPLRPFPPPGSDVDLAAPAREMMPPIGVGSLDALAGTEPLLAASLELGRQRGWKSVEFRDVADWSARSGSSVEFYGHTIDLTGGETAVLGRMASATVRSIRKADRQGIQIRIDNDIPAMRAYFELHCLTRQRHGQPPQPWPFFLAIQRHFLAVGHGAIVLALKDERPIAGAVFLFQGVGALYKFGASDENYQSLRPNNRVFWEAIQFCMQRGCKSLDLGRTSLANDGLRRFKLGWGSHERRIAYVRYDLATRQVMPTPDATTGWHTRIFQMLPIPVAKLLGRIAYRLAA
ncbi:MAG: GNAT family N-acetyltransferase [Verrucomicrobiales bacterium]|nr:GNAT family N-acetyltransferase [Verrucomicrobiales bacterium]